MCLRRSLRVLAAILYIGAITLALLAANVKLWITRRGTAIRLGCEAKGIRLYRRDRQVWVHQGRRIWPVSHPDQLRGLVRIRDETAALRYARLFTSGQVPANPVDWEILPWDAWRSLPACVRPHVEWTTSGQYGILDRDNYDASGLRPARVERVPGGFGITRWLLVQEQDRRSLRFGTDVARRVREFVGEDGRYLRTAMNTRPLPDLPATQWRRVDPPPPPRPPSTPPRLPWEAV